MKNLNTLKLMFFAAIGFLGAGIYFMTSNLKSIILIIGIAMVLGVFFRVLLRILEILEQWNDKE